MRDDEPIAAWEVGTGSGAVAVALALRFRTAAGPGPAAAGGHRYLAGGAGARVREPGCPRRGRARQRWACGDLLDVARAARAASSRTCWWRTCPTFPATRWRPAPAACATSLRCALDGGADGLDVIRRLLAQLPDRLAPGGVALLEIGPARRTQVRSAAERCRCAVPSAACRTWPASSASSGSRARDGAAARHDGGHRARRPILLRDGGLVAFPTDTVYGIGCAARDPRRSRPSSRSSAGRPRSGSPILVGGARAGRMPSVGRATSARAAPGGCASGPGALTLVLPARTDDRATQAFRAPDHPVALALIARRRAAVATSANISDEPETLRRGRRADRVRRPRPTAGRRGRRRPGAGRRGLHRARPER